MFTPELRVSSPGLRQPPKGLPSQVPSVTPQPPPPARLQPPAATCHSPPPLLQQRPPLVAPPWFSPRATLQAIGSHGSKSPLARRAASASSPNLLPLRPQNSVAADLDGRADTDAHPPCPARPPRGESKARRPDVEEKLHQWLATVPSADRGYRAWDEEQILDIARFAQESSAAHLSAEEIYRRYVVHQVEVADAVAIV